MGRLLQKPQPASLTWSVIQLPCMLQDTEDAHFIFRGTLLVYLNGT